MTKPGIVLLFLLSLLLGIILLQTQPHQQLKMTAKTQLLSDPFLQLPQENSVRVVWFTEFAGTRHQVFYGKQLKDQVTAITTKLSRTREDGKSKIAQPQQELPYPRDIWRHEAEVGGLKPNQRVPYKVASTTTNGEQVISDVFSLSPAPQTGQPLKILLTSDHQLMPMIAANLQKVAETVGQVDAVFLAGDLVNVPDRASEWFDDIRGGAFFPCLQGHANYELEKEGVKTTYNGAALIQSAPLFTAIGNHEVMGRFATATGLNLQFNDPYPQSRAKLLYQVVSSEVNPTKDPAIEANWLKSNSFNTDTYEEIFSLPQSITGGKKYYALTFGDVRLVVLYATSIWRSPQLGAQIRGRYRESDADLENSVNWGYGQHIFEPIAKGSLQYQWLERELQSEEFKQAKYKVVMLHHPPHSLGDNIVPAYTEPLPQIQYTPDGKIASVRYEYPLEQDYIIRDVEPLLESAGVNLVFYGHSHLWNRFVSASGVNFLESSNVGNSYGAYLGEKKRPIPDGYAEKYVATGDPNGLEPVVPTIKPLVDDSDQPLPYIASNEITVFSILDTAKGTVSSYRFDTRQPDSSVVKFDEFKM